MIKLYWVWHDPSISIYSGRAEGPALTHGVHRRMGYLMLCKSRKEKLQLTSQLSDDYFQANKFGGVQMMVISTFTLKKISGCLSILTTLILHLPPIEYKHPGVNNFVLFSIVEAQQIFFKWTERAERGREEGREEGRVTEREEKNYQMLLICTRPWDRKNKNWFFKVLL